ncbi:MAG: hypothetical protein ACTHOD_17165 [Motilibacteraceae bacterium]
MYILQADETNTEPAQGDFFLYGGLVVPIDRLPEIHGAVARVREKYGFANDDQFKFHTRTRPAALSSKDWTAAKAEVLTAASDLGVELIVYVVHHGIARGVSVEERNEYALNSLIAHFDMRYLNEKSSFGMVSIDRLNEKFGYGYLRDRFQNPLSLPDGRSVVLSRVLHYSMTCDGASHLSSLVDIALGGVRYCVNAATGRGKDDVAEQLFPAVAKLMWQKRVGDDIQVGGYGFLQYPKEIKAPVYREAYATLAETLANYAGSN